MGAERICSPEVTRSDTLKLAPARALGGPSHLSCAGPGLPWLEPSDNEAGGPPVGTPFAVAADCCTGETAAAAGGLAGGTGSPCAVSSSSLSALNCMVWRVPEGRWTKVTSVARTASTLYSPSRVSPSLIGKTSSPRATKTSIPESRWSWPAKRNGKGGATGTWGAAAAAGLGGGIQDCGENGSEPILRSARRAGIPGCNAADAGAADLSASRETAVDRAFSTTGPLWLRRSNATQIADPASNTINTAILGGRRIPAPERPGTRTVCELF